MAPEAPSKARWRRIPNYLQFERVALVCVMVMIGSIAVFAIVVTSIKLVGDIRLAKRFSIRRRFRIPSGLFSSS
jgi:hypothetical protein